MYKNRILIVNNEPETTGSLLMLLGVHGYEAVAVNNGQEALERDNGYTDLVLLDIDLPDINGFKVCAGLKTNRHTKHIPIIMLVSNRVGERIEGFRKGADDHLSKPVETEELLTRIGTSLRRRQGESGNGHASCKIVEQLHQIIDQEKVIPYFQPIYYLNPQCLMGVEVLSRPQIDGALSNPECLFQAAMRFGLYYELEMVVWRRALAIAKRAFYQEHLFLNCNPYLIESDRFDEVGHLFRAADMKPERVYLEITERSAIHNRKLYFKRLSNYRNSGFKIAIDDLGAGYSSLESIVDTKPDVVKMDRHIIHGLSEDGFKRSMVKLMVAFCHENGIICIAEGIETKRDLDVLTDLGVDAGQGYYFFRPNQAIDIEAMRAVRA